MQIRMHIIEESKAEISEMPQDWVFCPKCFSGVTQIQNNSQAIRKSLAARNQIPTFVATKQSSNLLKNPLTDSNTSLFVQDQATGEEFKTQLPSRSSGEPKDFCGECGSIFEVSPQLSEGGKEGSLYNYHVLFNSNKLSPSKKNKGKMKMVSIPSIKEPRFMKCTNFLSPIQLYQ